LAMSSTVAMGNSASLLGMSGSYNTIASET
jgi:hypothetical protein